MPVIDCFEPVPAGALAPARNCAVPLKVLVASLFPTFVLRHAARAHIAVIACWGQVNVAGQNLSCGCCRVDQVWGVQQGGACQLLHPAKLQL